MSHSPSNPPRRRWQARIAVGGLVVFVALLLATYATVVVARLAGYAVIVTRGSVDEAIPAGAVVVGRWTNPGEVQPGTRVIFEERDGARTGVAKLHRVVELAQENGHVLARTRQADSDADRRYVLSEAVMTPAFSLRLVGYVVSLLLTPLGWLLGFALPTGALCFLGIRRIWAPAEDPVATAAAPPRAVSQDR